MGSLGREPEVGWFPPFFSLWRRPLAVDGKAEVGGSAAEGILFAALPYEASASRRNADAAFQPQADEFKDRFVGIDFYVWVL